MANLTHKLDPVITQKYENIFMKLKILVDDSVRIMHIFSSPEPKAQGELLVSKGDAPASVVMRQQSSSSLKLLGRFTSNLVCSILVTITLEFGHVIPIGPF
jgi:hypothetical protein